MIQQRQLAIAFGTSRLAFASIALLGLFSLTTQAALTFTVGGAWPNDAHRTAAEDAIQAVVDRYNDYGDFGNQNVYVYYNAGIPTAQASYHGSIGFGGTYPAERVMAHEMAHYLGLPSSNWGNLMAGGSWSGELGLAKVRQFEGEQATINGDGAHFWPYGLNYDSEGTEINKQRQVAVVYAMRGDLGIGPTRHPSVGARGVVLTADDPLGTSGFNHKDTWGDGYYPHTGSNYFTGEYKLRTPTGGNSYRFYGDSLTINNTNGATGGLQYSGVGAGDIVTIDGLRLDGGWVQHVGSVGGRFRLDGEIDVASESVFYAKQGGIDLLASVTGSGGVTIAPTDPPEADDRYVRWLSAQNTYVGDLVNDARFELGQGANFRFDIGPAGSSNTIGGDSARSTRFNGVFELDLTNASSAAGDSWSLVTAANVTYGRQFEVAGFEEADGAWSNGDYTFTESTGRLTLVPSWSIDGGGAWSVASNWAGGVPTNSEAKLGSIVSSSNAPATISVDTPVSLNRLTFDNPSRYVLTGPNTITLTGGARVVAKSGSHELAVPLAGDAGLTLSGGGTVTLTTPSTFTGSTSIESGVLRLAGGGAIDGASSVEVQAGATFDVADVSGGYRLAPGQTLHTFAQGAVIGDIVARGGSMITGSGVMRGALVVQDGATLRVGDAGLPTSGSLAGRHLIDDFQDDTPGGLNAGATNGVWTSLSPGTSNAQVVSSGENNALEFFGASNEWRGVQTNLQTSFDEDHSLADGDSATYFLRVQRNGRQTIEGVFGLTDLDAIGVDSPSGELAIPLSLFQGTDEGDTLALRAYESDGVAIVVRNNVLPGEWINVWLVVDNQSKTFEVATSTGNDDGELFPRSFNFGHQATTSETIDSFAGAELSSNSSSRVASVRIDDFYRFEGSDLSNPLGLAGETLLIDGDYAQDAGGILQIDLHDPTTLDRLVVSGQFIAGGELAVALITGAPTPRVNDVFDVIDFASASGEFDTLDLPVLDAGLRWDSSRLLENGTLTVVEILPGDYNADGLVDAADYTLWRDHEGAPAGTLPNDIDGGAIGPAQLATWTANYGASQPALAKIPEPATEALIGALVLLASATRRSCPVAWL